MRVPLIIAFLLFVLASCSPKTYVFVGNEHRFGDLSDGLPDLDSTATTYYEGGSIKFEGKYAVTLDKQLSNIKAGEWKQYYENGQLKSEGNYKISSYLNCCVSGACREYYSYKDGLWKYYSEKGILEYEVEFKPDKLHVNTNCEGGDSVTFGIVKTIPLKYKGTLTPDNIFELQKVVLEEEVGYLTYTPLNGELYITFEPKK
ncbi:toxin-antitoxin system YwqK family antitoxin [Pontibacter sp. H249]|uniref:toxin-antitoxin system YwqK family antitoxin n=1 Tax=Pontibacter sp. H249 TaxID=3133420 RepID=UPI0030BF0046